MIPRRLFQTCKDPARIAPEFLPFVEEWRQFCGREGFRHEMFDDAAMDAFVREEDPQGYPAYRDLETMIEKTDYWRYLVVLRQGGYYADVDCRPQDGFRRLPQPRPRPVVQVEEDRWMKYTCNFCQLPEIGQFFFGFPAGSPILADVLAELRRRLVERPHRRLGRYQEILFTTGPGVFGAVLLKHRDEVEFYPVDALVKHLTTGNWTANLDRGPKRLLLRKCLLQLQSVA